MRRRAPAAYHAGVNELPPVHGRYPKAARLRRERDFVPLRRGGRRVIGAEAVLKLLDTGQPRARLGLAASKGYGNAPRRNRFRRLAREAFRRIAPELRAVDILAMPLRDLGEPTLDGLIADLRRAAARERP